MSITENGTETKRAALADRDWLDSNGDVLEPARPEEAHSVRYTLKEAGPLGAFGGGRSVEYKIEKPGSRDGMLAGFGFHTLAGNVVNTWKTLDESDRPASPVDMIEERIALLDSGMWIERAVGGGVGAKIDRDALAEAFVLYAEDKGHPAIAKAGGIDNFKTMIRTKIEEDDKFRRSVYADPAVKQNYQTLTGKGAGKSADDLLADL